MILVDTSIWVERDRGTGSAADRKLERLLETDEVVCTTNPIEMELLAVAPDGVSVRRLLLGVESIPFEPEADFPAAARLYAACRSVGWTPRGLIDCMIAAVALRTGATLFAQDRDFGRIAQIADLELLAF